MKFYIKYYKNNYEKLLTYYPRYYRDVFEMVEILKAYGKISDVMELQIEQAYLNNFVLEADETTIRGWEDILGITYSKPLSLEQRRRVIIARIAGHGHIGEPEIREVIANYTDKSVSVDFAKGIIYIVIEGEVFDENNLLRTLLRRIPAHLALDMRIHIRREFRQDLHISIGGAIGTELWPQPIGQDRQSTLPVKVSFGGATAAEFHPNPVSEDRQATSQIEIGFGGFTGQEADGEPHGEDHSSTVTTHSGGGAYYHTRTKSKLIG
ncbi:MAG TPA: YmfQ family protein [Candidatus Acutalibacter ornithocaccae]|uniref:YmfQ family protein n=1 Tax=Candidatus Acutalibacter ornithocaccae TaxID=2838416 RepID=A0A9D2RXM3_9FIRM|nr:YmfQ family protein [Candidatus Acutalibacter ornithocaccae]